jgi:hypothetical protein
MEFDPCPEQITQIAIRAMRIIRELKGLPEEKNVTTLFKEAVSLLAIHPAWVGKRTSGVANHLPSPSEMKTSQGTYVIPRRNCPKCGKENSFRLDPLCQSCEDAEGGKYKSMWFCGEMERGTKTLISGTGCGHKEPSKDSITKYKVEHGMEVEVGFKKEIGMDTRTEQGLK